MTLLHVLELPTSVDRSLTPSRIAMETTSRRDMEARLERVHRAGVAGEMRRPHGPHAWHMTYKEGTKARELSDMQRAIAESGMGRESVVAVCARTLLGQ